MYVLNGSILTCSKQQCIQECIYGTVQMQLHSQAQVSSKALKRLVKVTNHKLYECSRFSTLSSLVSITHVSICLLASYNFYRAL